VWLEHLLSGVSGRRNEEIDNVWPLLFLKYRSLPLPLRGRGEKESAAELLSVV
jgi:hypothetical protein